MALDASSSLGAAIGLQGVPKDYTMQFEQLGARKDAADANRELGKQKGLDEAKKRAEKKFEIKPGLYLDKRKPEVEKATSEFYQMMRDKSQQGINLETDTDIQMAATKLQSRLNELKAEHSFYNKDKNDVLSSPKDYSWDIEVAKKYEGDGDIPDEVYIGGAGKKYNGDTAKHFAEVGKGIGKDVNIQEWMNGTTQVKQEITKIVDEKNKKAASIALQGAYSGTDQDAKLDLNRIANTLTAEKSFSYKYTPEEQKQIIEQEFIKEKIGQFEIVQDFRKAVTITPDTTTERAKGSFGGGSWSNQDYVVAPSDGYVTMKSGAQVPEKILVNNIRSGNPKEVTLKVNEKGVTSLRKGVIKEFVYSPISDNYKAILMYNTYDSEGKPTGIVQNEVIDADYPNAAHEIGQSPWGLILGAPNTRKETRKEGGVSNTPKTTNTTAPKKVEAKKDWSKYKRN